MSSPRVKRSTPTSGPGPTSGWRSTESCWFTCTTIEAAVPRLAVAINRAARHKDESLGEPDDLDRVGRAREAIWAVEDPRVAAVTFARRVARAGRRRLPLSGDVLCPDGGR